MHDSQNIVIAVNDSDDALRAVRYVAKTLKSRDNLSIHLVCVYPDPPPDYYEKGGTFDAYNEIMQHQAGEAMAIAVSSLEKQDIKKENITTHIRLADGKTISNSILAVLQEYECDTLVVGKRGISKNEEFLFGSISNTLARKTKGFTTWIVG